MFFNQTNQSRCKTIPTVHWLNKDVFNLSLIVVSNEAEGCVFVDERDNAFRVDDTVL